MMHVTEFSCLTKLFIGVFAQRTFVVVVVVVIVIVVVIVVVV